MVAGSKGLATGTWENSVPDWHAPQKEKDAHAAYVVYICMYGIICSSHRAYNDIYARHLGGRPRPPSVAVSDLHTDTGSFAKQENRSPYVTQQLDPPRRTSNTDQVGKLRHSLLR